MICAAGEGGGMEVEMNKRRIICLFLALVLAMLFPMENISVQAKSDKKKIMLSKSKVTLYVGKSIKLKVKNTKKKVKWSSSKKKVATVDSKGRVKAKKAGKTTIIAKIGKKQLKCKVTVKKKPLPSATSTPTPIPPITVSSVSVLNSYTVMVGLSAPQSITAANFTVKVKIHEKGTYNIARDIESIFSSDQRNYKITLASNSGIEEGTYVQVTVKGLQGSGTVSKDTYFKNGTYQYTSDFVYRATQGQAVSERIYLSGLGYSSFTVSGLPAGISANMDDRLESIKLTGKPAKAGEYQAKIVADDELGDSYVYNMMWLVGSSNHIAAGVTPTYGILSDHGDFTIYAQRFQVVGGSGSYDYAIQGDSHGIEVMVDGSGPYLKGTLQAAGTYKIHVQVTDSGDSKLTTTFEYLIDIKEGVAVSGMIQDAKGNPFASSYNRINFENNDKGNRYYSFGSIFSQGTGLYTEQLLPGTYHIWVTNSQGNLISETATVTVTAFRTVNFKLPVYPITIYSDMEEVSSSSFGKWLDDNDNEYGSGARLYLKPGTYHLHTASTDSLVNATATLDITVNANMTSATAKVTSESAIVGSVTEEEPLVTTVGSVTKTYSFVPQTTGKYYIWSEGSKDTYGILCDAEGTRLRFNDDSGPGHNFYISYDCEAGTTYYIAVYLVSGNPGETTLHVSATEPQFTS